MFHRPNASNPQPTQDQQGENKTMTQSTETESQTATETRSADIPANPFQRSNASAPAAAASRPATPSYGSFPSYGASPSSSTALSNGRRLVIGQGITMSGEIESCDHLVVEGTVEAALKGASVLEIAETGMFYGTVEISEATIAGKFEGEITVNGRLTVRSTGSITGALSYKELAVEAGATIDGKINPVGGSRQASEKKSQKPKAAEDLPILRAAGQ